jgi:hypothetical protein
MHAFEILLTGKKKCRASVKGHDPKASNFLVRDSKKPLRLRGFA